MIFKWRYQSMDKSPEKRSEALSPLTRHHHHALVIGLNLRRAGSNDTYTFSRVQEDLREFWQEGGQDHFQQEEEVLLPLYSRFASLEKAEIIRMLLQHVQIRAAVDFLLNDAEATVDTMHTLGELLANHVHLEEEQVFPLIERSVPEVALNRLSFHQGITETNRSFSHAREDKVRQEQEKAHN
ncbi:hemerythrin domain-containing protein [Alicyclobacillaceae bacterium I2511]|nr:hemerythrin domain-containing protein [Alicyclobacillaceae bacterium I2511]